MRENIIMLVDDDKEFLEELQDTLMLSGYKTLALQDSALVMQEVQRLKPDVIVLDLKMSPISGFEVAKSLRRVKSTSKIPIIAMTGFFTEDEGKDLLEKYGVQSFLKKPFNPLDIIASIENELERDFHSQQSS